MLWFYHLCARKFVRYFNMILLIVATDHYSEELSKKRSLPMSPPCVNKLDTDYRFKSFPLTGNLKWVIEKEVTTDVATLSNKFSTFYFEFTEAPPLLRSKLCKRRMSPGGGEYQPRDFDAKQRLQKWKTVKLIKMDKSNCLYLASVLASDVLYGRGYCILEIGIMFYLTARDGLLYEQSALVAKTTHSHHLCRYQL